MKGYPHDHYLVGDNPFGKEDTWLSDKGSYYKAMVAKEQARIRFDTRSATQKDIDEVKKTNYLKISKQDT